MTEPSGGGGRARAVLPRGVEDRDSRWRMMVVPVVFGPQLADRSICVMDVAESTQEHREFIGGVRNCSALTSRVQLSDNVGSIVPSAPSFHSGRAPLSYSCPRRTRSPMTLWPQASEERTRSRASWPPVAEC
jgi:hypothetical protein